MAINEYSLAHALARWACSLDGVGEAGDYVIESRKGAADFLTIKENGKDICDISNMPEVLRISAYEMPQEELFKLVNVIQNTLEKPSYPISGCEPCSWKGILTDEQIKALDETPKYEFLYGISPEGYANLKVAELIYDYSKDHDISDLFDKGIITREEWQHLAPSEIPITNNNNVLLSIERVKEISLALSALETDRTETRKRTHRETERD